MNCLPLLVICDPFSPALRGSALGSSQIQLDIIAQQGSNLHRNRSTHTQTHTIAAWMSYVWAWDLLTRLWNDMFCFVFYLDVIWLDGTRNTKDENKRPSQFLFTFFHPREKQNKKTQKRLFTDRLNLNYLGQLIRICTQSHGICFFFPRKRFFFSFEGFVLFWAFQIFKLTFSFPLPIKYPGRCSISM